MNAFLSHKQLVDNNRKLSVSIVCFNNNVALLQQAIKSVLQEEVVDRLFILDNSPTTALQKHCELDDKVHYVFNGKNLGYGKAHNIAMQQSIDEGYSYHLVVNPDVFFEKNTLKAIVDFMDASPNVGLLMPKVLYPSGEEQFLCKLLPSPFDLFVRRFVSGSAYTQKRQEVYELRFTGYSKAMNVPYLSGCFMFFRNSALQEIGLFDENIFMYIEDCDITRRMHKKYQTLFWPEVSIFHHYQKGSYKNLLLMLYNLHGAAVYFTKYGWIADPEREQINQQVLRELGYCF